MKTYVLTVSKNFPNTHKRKGEPTYFVEKILNELNDTSFQYKKLDEIAKIGVSGRKLHTIRKNYSLWKERFEEIDRGEACLSLRYWSESAYKSKQVEFARLTSEDGIGLQRLEFDKDLNGAFSFKLYNIDRKFATTIDKIACNDGLSFEDFKEWFKGYDLSEPMAIIHFTKFRY